MKEKKLKIILMKKEVYNNLNERKEVYNNLIER